MTETPGSSSSSTLPTFPSHIIHGLAKEFVDLFSSIRETPVPFLWLAFVTYFGNLISPYVRLNSASSEPRFFGVAIGRSARTRKSSGQNTVRDIFERVQKRLGTKTQLVLLGLGSVEGVMEQLETHKGPAILHLDEMNQLAAKTSIEGSAGTAPLHKLWEDHDYQHLKANNKSYNVKNMYLSLIGASTLEDFQKSWDCKHADAGFFSRLFVVVADTNKCVARPIDPDPEAVNDLVEGIVKAVEALKRKPGEIGGYSYRPQDNNTSRSAGQRVFTLTPEAEQAWQVFYQDNFSNSDDIEWNRIDAYGERFMALQAVLRNEQEVTEENVREVIELLEYEVAARRMVRPIVAENTLAQLEEIIRRALPEGASITKRDLERATSARRYGIQVFNTALNNLRSADEITLTSLPKKSVLVTRLPEETRG